MTEINNKKQKDWRVLEFFVPITEKISENNDFFIRGVAINETTTLNNVKYIAEELEKAAVSFRNVPVLLDHRNEVKNIVGRTTENVNYSSPMKRIEFEAKIMDNDIREMIADGRIGSVSIGARVENLTEEEDGSMKAIGIHGLEISLVAVPGDNQATLAHAIENGMHLKEMYEEKAQKSNSTSVGGQKLNLIREDNMTKEVLTKEDAPEVTKEVPEVPEVPEEPKEVPEVSEEKVSELEKINEKIANVTLELRKQELATLQNKISESEKPKVVEKVDNTKGVIVDKKEEVTESDNKVIEAIGKGNYAMYRDYTSESADTKLKRLVR